MKRVLMITATILAFAALPLGLFGCNSEAEPTLSETATETETQKATQKVTETDVDRSTEGVTTDPYEQTVTGRTVDLALHADKVKRLGRTVLLDNGIACDHSASGIELRGVMVGGVTLEIESVSKKSNSPATYFTVYLDGKRQGKRLEVSGKKLVTVADFKDEKEHTVRIVKQTETNYTISNIKKLYFTGYLLTPPEDKELYIEFIGDSLTCGMGNIGTNSSSEPQSAKWEDATQGYPYLLAQELDADYSIISESGIGIAGSWGDHSIFQLYGKASYKRDPQTDHVFERTPDLFVINLGTNDYYINANKNKDESTIEAVIEKTVELIKTAREAYGKDVPIVWVSRFVGLGDNYVAAFEEGIRLYAVEKTGEENATGEDVGIYRLDVTPNSGGAQWHPNTQGHSRAKNEILAFIKDKGLLK